MKYINLFLLLLVILTSCGGLKEAGKVLRNEKITTTDEFLIKKRKPLVLPPDYNEIPEPGKISKSKKNEEEKIKEILKIEDENENKSNKSSSVEDSILKRIRKW